MSTNSKSVFPTPELLKIDGSNADEVRGITLRDYFAAKAMLGLDVTRYAGGYTLLAENAYKIADAMLAERERGND